MNKNYVQDFPGDAVVKNPPANAGDMGSIPDPGSIPHVVEQLSPSATTTEPALQSPRPTTTEARTPRARALQQEKACAQQRRPNAAKNK